MTVSLIPPIFFHGGVQVDNEALPSWLRPNRPSKVDLNEEFGPVKPQTRHAHTGPRHSTQLRVAG